MPERATSCPAAPSLGVLLNVWGGDDASHLEKSIHSVINQQRQADEIVVVADGPLTPALDTVLRAHRSHLTSIVRHDEARGLAHGRNTGLMSMKADFIALQDADDVSHPSRLDIVFRALCQLRTRPVMISTPMVEFRSETGVLIGIRPGPRTDQPVVSQLRRSNPLNHPTVVLHRESFLARGPYVPLHKLEDYATWAKLASLEDSNFAVINVPTVAFRITEAYVRRRGGKDLLRSEIKLQRLLHEMLPNGISVPYRVARLAYTAAPTFARAALSRRLLSQSYRNLPVESLDQFLEWSLDGSVASVLPHTS